MAEDILIMKSVNALKKQLDKLTEDKLWGL